MPRGKACSDIRAAERICRPRDSRARILSIAFLRRQRGALRNTALVEPTLSIRRSVSGGSSKRFVLPAEFLLLRASNADCLGGVPFREDGAGGILHNAFRSRNRWNKSRDRESTRLNSSHSQISYAVFCL